LRVGIWGRRLEWIHIGNLPDDKVINWKERKLEKDSLKRVLPSHERQTSAKDGKACYFIPKRENGEKSKENDISEDKEDKRNNCNCSGIGSSKINSHV